MPVPERHFVLGTPLEPPFPEGLEQAIVGMGCFWGAERVFWQAPGVYTTAVGYAGGITPNPTYEEVCSARPATPRRCWSSSTRRRPATRRSCGCSGRTTTRRRACARATTSARSTARRSTGPPRSSAGSPRRAATRTRSACASRLRRDHDRDRPGGAVLLRRGLPPAVPGEEPRRLLRARRHRRELPGRDRRELGRCDGSRSRAGDGFERLEDVCGAGSRLRPAPANQPPATAGRIVTSSPSVTGVSSPSRKRMSSPPT